MPNIQRTCKLTGKGFEVSELEQRLRQSFGVDMPDIHPYERLRHMMCFRNIITLYYDTCDLCHKQIVSVWGENPIFPVYCPSCWNSDLWELPEMELDLDRSFFDQFKELVNKTPHFSQSLLNPENSDFCNMGTGLKNCYMTFNVTFGEDCYYTYGGMNLKNCVDSLLSDESEFLYESRNCRKSYQVFWSELAINCTECYFVYDCIDCTNCTLSTGLRHKQYVFLNQQLTPQEYTEKMKELQSGEYEVVQTYLKKYEELKRAYPKKYILGSRNEDVTGNIVFDSKNLVDSYHALFCEDSANMFNIWRAKDSLDTVAFGGTGVERVYSCVTVGHQSMNLKFCVNSYDACHDLEYCYFVVSSQNSFGCVFGRKLEYRILNKQYSPEEYAQTVQVLKEKMLERGEYGEMFRLDLIPHAYNESMAQMVMPLTQQQAEDRGYRWVNKKIPQVSPDMVIQPTTSIQTVEWSQVQGKVILCEETGRPFKLVKPEFDFYKQFNLPLPRIHPEVRLLKKYPREMMFNLHTDKCHQCSKEVQTSMPEGEPVLCETCYQAAVNA